MDYKRRTIVIVCLLTFVEIWNLISCTGISFTKYHHESILDGYRCVPKETSFEIDNVFAVVQCAKLCQRTDMCANFFYHPDSHKCIGCRFNSGETTTCNQTYPGSKHFRSKPSSHEENNVWPICATDCKGIRENYNRAPSGLYKIRLWKSKKIRQVFCDMETAGGGWTIFQNRFNGSVDFYRNFSEYEDGFGELNGEFWLGLQYVQEMVSQAKTELRLDLTKEDGETGTETFQNFRLDKGPYYSIHMDNGTGALELNGKENGISRHPGSHFSTYDADRETRLEHCAVKAHGAWWYNNRNCGLVNLNGRYVSPGTKSFVGMYYWSFYGWLSLKGTKMMFRRV